MDGQIDRQRLARRQPVGTEYKQSDVSEKRRGSRVLFYWRAAARRRDGRRGLNHKQPVSPKTAPNEHQLALAKLATTSP